jgi:hypothetical protein
MQLTNLRREKKLKLVIYKIAKGKSITSIKNKSTLNTLLFLNNPKGLDYKEHLFVTKSYHNN